MTRAPSPRENCRAKQETPPVAQNEDRVAGFDPPGGDDGIPGGDAGAGQGGGLLEAEVLGDLDHALFPKQNLLGERAVDVAAESAFELFRCGIAVEPVLEKDAGDAIADRDLRYSLANSGDDSGATLNRESDAAGASGCRLL